MAEENELQPPERQHESFVLSKKAAKRPWYHISWLDGCVAVGFMLFLAMIAMPRIGLRYPREAAQRTTCMNNIRQIALAMTEYSSVHRSFSPAYIADENGKPIHSWRVLLLPYLEQQALYDAYSMDEPWDGPNNSKLHDRIAEVYRCPSSDGSAGATNYCLVIGPGTAFVGSERLSGASVTDGLSNTILLVEVNSNRIGACQPKDLTIDEAIREIRWGDEDVSHHHPGGCVVARMDGSTLFVDAEVDAETLREAMLIADGKTPDLLLD